MYAGPDEPYLFGRRRVLGPDPEHRSYRSFASFSDPDGNGWLFQEITTRLPGRVDAAATVRIAGRSRERAAACGGGSRRAREAHRQHDANWADWYAEYMVAEQAGEPLPT